MTKRLLITLAVVVGMSVVYGCNAGDKGEKGAAEADKVATAAAAGANQSTEVVFDPRNPPAGYTKCHRNHCHREDGGVESYKQVMDAIGATKIIGVPKERPSGGITIFVGDCNSQH